MFIVIAQENHPDRLIEKIYGPFDSYDEAQDWATGKEDSADNIIEGYNIHKFWYYVRELEVPK